MAHSVEFLLDHTSDQQIRTQWAALAEAGLPNQAAIRASTNRPHITAIAAPRISPEIDGALATLGMRLPVAVTLGDIVVLGSGPRRVVARLVVPTSELLSVHAAIVRLGAEYTSNPDRTGTGLFAHSRPGAWTPHVTLARRVRIEQLAAVFEILAETGTGDHASVQTTITGLRRWDSDATTEHLVDARGY